MSHEDDDDRDIADVTRELTRHGRALREALDRNSNVTTDVAETKLELRSLRESHRELARALRGDGNGDKGLTARTIRLEGHVERIVGDMARQDERRFQTGLMLGGALVTAFLSLAVAVFAAFFKG